MAQLIKATIKVNFYVMESILSITSFFRIFHPIAKRLTVSTYFKKESPLDIVLRLNKTTLGT